MARLFLMENTFTPVNCRKNGLGRDVRIALEEIASRDEWHDMTREVYGTDATDPWYRNSSNALQRRTAYNVSVQIGNVNITTTAQEMFNICETITTFMNNMIHN